MGSVLVRCWFSVVLENVFDSMLISVMLICIELRKWFGFLVSFSVVLVLWLFCLVSIFSWVGWVEMMVNLDMVNRLLIRVRRIMIRILSYMEGV